MNERNMNDLDYMLSVMQAAKEGKEIQMSNKLGRTEWIDTSVPSWDWANFDYRVKPVGKLRPYENAKEFLDAMKEHGPFITRNGEPYRMALTVFDDRVNYECTWGEYKGLIELGCKWQDGTPCGVEEGGEV